MSSVKYIVFVTILFFAQIQCMHRAYTFFSRVGTLGCQAFYGACTAGPATLTYTGLLFYDTDSDLKEHESPTQLEETFVRKQLLKAGITNPESIRIITDKQTGYYVNSIYKLMAIDPYLCNTHYRLDTLLRREKRLQNPSLVTRLFTPESELSRIRKIINQHKALIQHEATHLIHNDGTRMAVAAGIVPLATHILAKAFLNKSALLHPFLKIPGGIGLYFVNWALFYTYSRHREYEADAGITNDIKYLQAFQTFLRDNQGEVEKTITRSPAIELYQLTSTHPLPAKRIARIDKRIEELRNL